MAHNDKQDKAGVKATPAVGGIPHDQLNRKAIKNTKAKLLDPTQNARIACIGDSITEGFNASSKNAWVESVADRLREATGRPANPSSKYRRATYTTGIFWFTFGGPASAIFGNGMANVSMLMQAGSTATIQIPENTTGFELYFNSSVGSSNAEIRVDGVLVDTVAVPVLGVLTYAQRFYVPITPGPAVNLQITSVGLNLFEGIQFYTDDEDDGIVVVAAGNAGATAQSFLAGGGGTGLPLATMAAHGDFDLISIALGVNDHHVGVSVDTHIANMELIIDRFREGKAGQEIILQIATERVLISTITVNTWKEYREAQIDLAFRKNCAILDVERVLGSFTTAGNRYQADNVHPNNIGHLAISKAMSHVLTGRGT